MAGNIHGDETVGGQVLQRWVWETCNQPTAQQEEVAQSMQAYYMPMFNPDGYEKNQRGNGKNQDLNRAFPTPTGTERPEQPEVVAYIAFAKSHEFDISMMYHGGAIVVNYAYGALGVVSVDAAWDARMPGSACAFCAWLTAASHRL
jgi:succinylglutamate desuccinylase